ncbi:hypothetical protein HZP50_07045 [Elizabethkingia anophelis]|nr:hypothetical protein [Elizabethkingia anophelis]MDV3877835.1 hypothetical protein [Elizabethkingia anophelis]
MEAKDKAEKLYWKYLKLLWPSAGQYMPIRKDKKILAIQCAMVCVEEIILTLSLSPARVDSVKQTVSYWKDIKQELEKMKV